MHFFRFVIESRPVDEPIGGAGFKSKARCKIWPEHLCSNALDSWVEENLFITATRTKGYYQKRFIGGIFQVLSSMLSTTSATTSAISAFTTMGVAEVSVAAVVCLIVLLSASEILSASKLWNKHLSNSLNLAILPLVVTFFAIVAFNVVKVL